MDVKRPDFVPQASMSKSEMRRLQRELASIAEFEDDFLGEIDVVAGIDQAFLSDKVVSAVVVMENGEIKERVDSVSDIELEYIPGLLAFREGKPIVDALQLVESDVDVLVLDGSGRIHFREAGIATHIGVVFDSPSLGVAKNLLCGSPEYEIEGMDEGDRISILADNRVNAAQDEVIGYAYQSKQFGGSRKVNPLYVSPGHRVCEETAVDIVESLNSGYKLPEPIRLADKYVSEVKNKIKS